MLPAADLYDDVLANGERMLGAGMVGAARKARAVYVARVSACHTCRHPEDSHLPGCEKCDCPKYEPHPRKDSMMAKTQTLDDLIAARDETRQQLESLEAFPSRRGPKVQRLRNLDAKIEAAQAEQNEQREPDSFAEVASAAPPVPPTMADLAERHAALGTMEQADVACGVGLDVILADTVTELSRQPGNGRTDRTDVAPRAGRWARQYRVYLEQKGVYRFRANVAAATRDAAAAQARAALVASGVSEEEAAKMRVSFGGRDVPVLLP